MAVDGVSTNVRISDTLHSVLFQQQLNNMTPDFKKMNKNKHRNKQTQKQVENLTGQLRKSALHNAKSHKHVNGDGDQILCSSLI